MGTKIHNSTSNEQFRKIKPICCPILSIHNLHGVKLIARLRLGFNHLCEHKFRHNFHDTLNQLCSSSLEPETASCYLCTSTTCPLLVHLL